MQSCRYWKHDTLPAIVICGSAYFEDICKGNANFSELPHTPNTYGGNIDVSFVLSSKGTLVCNTPSNILVLNRTSPSLLHTFVAYSTQLPIAIQNTGNSFLHQHIPCKAFGRLLVLKSCRFLHGSEYRIWFKISSG